MLLYTTQSSHHRHGHHQSCPTYHHIISQIKCLPVSISQPYRCHHPYYCHLLISLRRCHLDNLGLCTILQLHPLHILRCDEDVLFPICIFGSIDLNLISSLSITPQGQTYKHISRQSPIDLIEEDVPFVQTTQGTTAGFPEGKQEADCGE